MIKGYAVEEGHLVPMQAPLGAIERLVWLDLFDPTVLGFLGYLIATYLIGRALWGWSNALPPDTFFERALTALMGALAVVLIGLVPFLGWLVILILTLTGLGALAVGVFRPELRTKY